MKGKQINIVNDKDGMKFNENGGEAKRKKGKGIKGTCRRARLTGECCKEEKPIEKWKARNGEGNERKATKTEANVRKGKSKEIKWKERESENATV